MFAIGHCAETNTNTDAGAACTSFAEYSLPATSFHVMDVSGLDGNGAATDALPERIAAKTSEAMSFDCNADPPDRSVRYAAALRAEPMAARRMMRYAGAARTAL